MDRMMIVFLGVVAYFLLGAIVTFYIAVKQNSTQRRQSWIKYSWYAVIVFLVLIAAWLHGYYILVLGALIVAWGIVEISRLFIPFRDGKPYFFLASLVIFLMVSTAFIAFLRIEKEWIIYTYLLVMVSDASSQHAGQLFGKIPFPGKISPGKTLEGFLGGLGMTLLTAAIIHPLPGIGILASLLIGFSISVFANAGDLLASLYKRKFEAKDFSHLIPGHGGILDRFDSFIMAGAWIYLFNLLRSLS